MSFTKLALAESAQTVLGPILIALAAAAMFAWSWEKWADPIVDFGRELYVPWRLTEGDVLYRDIAYFNGPLSPYFNALMFRTFGVSFHTLAFVNLFIFAIVAAIAYGLLGSVAGRFAAGICGIVLVAVFGFGQWLNTGNYNFIAPYSHEITHGFVLGLGAVACVFRLPRTKWAAWAAGLLLGLAFLTKPEIFVAAAAAVAVGVAAHLWLERASIRRVLTVVVPLLGALASPALLSTLLLSLAMPVPEAARATLGAWKWVGDERVASIRLYRILLGTEDVERSLLLVAGWSVGLLAFFAALYALAARTNAFVRWLVPMASIVVLAVVGMPAFREPRYFYFFATPFPLCLVVLGARQAAVLVGSDEATERARACGQLTLTIFALVLLAKMALRVTVIHYGFVLALPGTLLLTAAAVAWFPAWVAARGGSAWVARVGALVPVGAMVGFALVTTARWFSARTVHLSNGADQMLVDRRGSEVKILIEDLAARVTPGQTLAVMPEGATVNYYTRMVNPTGYVNFMPLELILFGERDMVDAFARHPPDFVALIGRDTSEYGVEFGRTYGQELLAWVNRRYAPVRVWRAPALRSASSGIAVLLRYALPSPPGASTPHAQP
jgi:hypothetical protein